MPFDRQNLIRHLSPPLDPRLTAPLLDEYSALVKRFALRDWEPAELDGGQFAEIAARILYHQDSGSLALTKGVNECLNYVDDLDRRGERLPAPNSHAFPDSNSARHMSKLLRATYKFRSARGAVHVSPTYTANEVDARIVFEMCKWVLAELLRVFLNAPVDEVAGIIHRLAQFDVPVVGEYWTVPLVQRTDLTTEEEILILLHHAGEDGLTQSDLRRAVLKDSSSISRALAKLTNGISRQAVKDPASGRFAVTALGIRRVMSDLAPKMLTH